MAANDDCIFCKISQGTIPSKKVLDENGVFVIEDLNPVAPVHMLIIPHEHIATVADLEDRHAEMVGRAYLAAAKVAKSLGFLDAGYRVVSNCRDDGGQTVGHIHFHLLAGRSMTWPPG
jgi:histidine triad (HIT) family protein